jgi:hypothetical protein
MIGHLRSALWSKAVGSEGPKHSKRYIFDSRLLQIDR